MRPKLDSGSENIGAYLHHCACINTQDIRDCYKHGDMNAAHDKILKSLEIDRLYKEWLELWHKANEEPNYFGYSEIF